jgi:hypothetical protein
MHAFEFDGFRKIQQRALGAHFEDIPGEHEIGAFKTS